MTPRASVNKLKNALMAWWPGQWSIQCTDHFIRWRVVRVNHQCRTTAIGAFSWEALRVAKYDLISKAIQNIEWWKVTEA